MTTTAARFGFAGFVVDGDTIARLLAIIYVTKVADSQTRGLRAGAVSYGSFIQAVREIAAENLEQRTSESVAELEADSIARLAWYRAIDLQEKT